MIKRSDRAVAWIHKGNPPVNLGNPAHACLCPRLPLFLRESVQTRKCEQAMVQKTLSALPPELLELQVKALMLNKLNLVADLLNDYFFSGVNKQFIVLQLSNSMSSLIPFFTQLTSTSLPVLTW